jgi:hypothetical protein
MNIFFLVVCGMGMAFFGFFLQACHRDTLRSKSLRSPVVKVSPEIQVINSPAGRHYLIHLEKQMADFLFHHQSGSSVEPSRPARVGPVIRP